jgi:hypothetical protein
MRLRRLRVTLPLLYEAGGIEQFRTPIAHPVRGKKALARSNPTSWFLAFKAVTATMEVPLLVRLRGESKDLVQRVVSFV